MTTPKKILQSKGIRPLRRLGQTFLNDRNAIDKILGVLEIQDDDVVVEIGAGIGIMTEEMAKRARKVVALEIDFSLLEVLKERLAGYQNIEVIRTDVLDFDFSAICSISQVQKVKVMGNIPYNISSQILFRLINYRKCISCMVLMFQKELADRICAHPGSRDYGIPSVLVHMYLTCTRELKVPGTCFYPEPKVMSTVLKMVFRDEPQVALKNHDLFTKIVRIAFSKRRKTLLNNLKSMKGYGYSEERIHGALSNCFVDGGRRAETLTAEEFGAISNALLESDNS